MSTQISLITKVGVFDSMELPVTYGTKKYKAVLLKLHRASGGILGRSGSVAKLIGLQINTNIINLTIVSTLPHPGDDSHTTNTRLQPR